MPKKGNTGTLQLFSGVPSMYYTPSNDPAFVPEMLERFGWAGEDYRNTPITGSVEEATPRQEDFLPFQFRHISATIVGAGTWKATDFSKPGVLKAAAKMLQYKPAYVNHEMEVSNIIGTIGKVEFTPAFKAKDGTLVPPGLDAPIWIDAKLHGDLCRKLQAFPVPSIQSVSITVLYEWEPSHTFQDSSGVEDAWEFERRIGGIDQEDGKMIRRIVTKIIEIYESSLVWVGADPFAKLQDANGDPINPEKAGIVPISQFDKDPSAHLYKENNYHFIQDFSFSSDNALYLRNRLTGKEDKSGKQNPQPAPNKLTMNEKLVKHLAAQLNKSEDEITLELIQGYTLVPTDEFDKQKAESEKVAGLTKEKEAAVKSSDGFKVEKQAAEAKVVEFEKIMPHDKLEEFAKGIDLDQVVPMATFGAEVTTARKNECIRQYKLTLKKGEEPDEAALKLINNADDEALRVYMKQYGVKLMEEEFTATCTECGNGDSISFRSSEADDGKKEETDRPSMAQAHRS